MIRDNYFFIFLEIIRNGIILWNLWKIKISNSDKVFSNLLKTVNYRIR